MAENEDKFRIEYKNLPPKVPIKATAFWWMFLNYTNAPKWLFGVIGIGLFVVWGNFFYRIFNEKAKDIFDR